MTLIHTLNECSAIWAEAMCGSLIDTSVLLIVVAVAWSLLRKRISAHVGYCLFLIVVVKAMIPLEFSGPNWAAELSPRVQLGRLFTQEKTPEPQLQQVPLIPPVSVPDPIPITETETVEIAPSDFVWETAPQVEVAAFHDVPVLADPTPLTAPAAATPAGPLEREEIATTTLFMLAWLLGTIGMTGWFALVQFRFRRRLRGAAEVAAEELPVDFAALCKQAGVSASVRLLRVEGVSSPAIWGLRKPRLLLPPDFTSMFSQQQMRWILLHELAHVRRRDLWVTLFQRLVQIVHFFNPAVWIANRIVDRLREYACDDAATIGAESSRRDCGEAFLRAVERANAQPQTLEPTLGIFRPGRAFHRRLFRILDPNRRIQARLSYRSGLLLLLLAALVLPCVRAAEEESESNAAPEIADAQEDSNEAEPAKYIANLPDGSRVELVGVSAHPSRGRRWWRADGSTLPAAPYAHVDGNMKVGGGMIGREFVFRISGALGLPHPYVRDAEITLAGSGGSSSNGVPSNEEGEPIQDLYVKTFVMPVGTKQARFRVGLPVGEWESTADFKGASSFATTFTLDDTSYGLTVTPAQQIGTDVVLNFAHNATKEKIQVVAIGTDGKTQHKHGRLSALGTGSFMQMTATFNNLKLSDVKRFSIQTRKQNYVKFENISTIPGHETDVQISVEGAPKTPVVIASKVDESADEKQPFIVQGRVTDADGQPIPEAKISLYKLSSGDSAATPIYITNTDKEGRYKHRFEPSSLWLTGHPNELLRIGVSVEKPGYQMTEGVTYYPAVNRLPDERVLALSGKAVDDIIVRGKPKTIDFVLKHRDLKTAPLSPKQKSFIRDLTSDLSDITKPLPASRAKSDEKAIIGKWKVTKLIEKNSTRIFPDTYYIIREGGIGTSKSPTQSAKFTYTLHSKKDSKIFSVRGAGDNANAALSFFYQLKGDQLKLLFGNPDESKPIDFDVEMGENFPTYLLVLTRVKDEPSKGAAQQEKLNPPGWGSVTGQFLLAGEVPQPRVLVAEGDTRAKDSAISAVKTIYSEELIVDPKSKGIANVFVYVRKVPKIHPDLLHSKTKTVVCESDGLVFKPHAMLLRTDQQLVFKNADPVVINVHSFPQRNVGFNAIMPPEEREGITFSIRQSEHRPFAIKNDLHAWMSAHCLVLDHPYAALTDKEGRFTIENLPAGEHELVIWHEKYGYFFKRHLVEIKNGETVSINRTRVVPQTIMGNPQKPVVDPAEIGSKKRSAARVPLGSRPDKEAILGEWKLVGRVVRGDEVLFPIDEGIYTVLIYRFKAKGMGEIDIPEAVRGDASTVFRYSLDSSSKPKTMVFQGKKSVYELKNDRLVITKEKKNGVFFERVKEKPPAEDKADAPIKGSTRFLNIPDKAARVVYVIDCSGSMYENRAINTVKKALKNSIALLDSKQQFQIILYNDQPYALNNPGPDRDVHFASDGNKQLANTFIDKANPEGGTEHALALALGLSKHPDVMYFLTDSDRPQLTNEELKHIKQLNKDGARIHCIEISHGSKKVVKPTWLVKLAHDNNGKYVYLDATKF